MQQTTVQRVCPADAMEMLSWCQCVAGYGSYWLGQVLRVIDRPPGHPLPLVLTLFSTWLGMVVLYCWLQQALLGCKSALQ